MARGDLDSYHHVEIFVKGKNALEVGQVRDY